MELDQMQTDDGVRAESGKVFADTIRQESRQERLMPSPDVGGMRAVAGRLSRSGISLSGKDRRKWQ